MHKVNAVTFASPFSWDFKWIWSPGPGRIKDEHRMSNSKPSATPVRQGLGSKVGLDYSKILAEMHLNALHLNDSSRWSLLFSR